MNYYSIDEYKRAGCEQMTGIMIAVHTETGGRVCDTGCSTFEDGSCPAYKKLIHKLQSTSKVAIDVETVRQESVRKGISISEVRKQRQVNKQEN